VVVLIDPARHDLRWANAGHHPALLIGNDDIVTALEPTGPLLSALDGEWSSRQTVTRDGDALIGFTDGLVEGSMVDGAAVESDHLLLELLAIPAETRREPQETLERILASMRERAAEWTRDDITLVAIAFTE
jgi:serine phosphatase RsbU (regulator of sigma subunit)